MDKPSLLESSMRDRSRDSSPQQPPVLLGQGLEPSHLNMEDQYRTIRLRLLTILEPTHSLPGQASEDRPCDCVRSRVDSKGRPHERRIRQWVRARAKKSGRHALMAAEFNPGSRVGHRAHVAALAYMSDNYFIGTTFACTTLRFSGLSSPHPMLAKQKGRRRIKPRGRTGVF